MAEEEESAVEREAASDLTHEDQERAMKSLKTLGRREFQKGMCDAVEKIQGKVCG